jgi:hypothetical protein
VGERGNVVNDRYTNKRAWVLEVMLIEQGQEMGEDMAKREE